MGKINFENTQDIPVTPIYSDERITLIDNLQNLKDDTNAITLDVCLLCLCTNGQATLFANGKPYSLKKNDLLFCLPNIILEKSKISDDFQVRVIAIDINYINALAPVNKKSWNFRWFIEENPVLSLKKEEVELFIEDYDLLLNKLRNTNSKHKKEITDALLTMFFYELHDSLERFVDTDMDDNNSAKQIFNKFIEQLTSLNPKQRSVSFYADKLNISPKYFSVVCKTVSGETASEIINKYMMKDIDFMLLRTNMSIKEIAFELDFPNLSFFGKYVKRMTGMSPKEYRRFHLRQNQGK